MTPLFRIQKIRNISVSLRIIPIPTKMILGAFRNNSGLVIFICEKQPKHFRQLRNISEKYILIFSQEKFQKLPEQFWHSPKLPGALRNLFGLVVYPETTFRFSLSELFRRLRNLSGDFISDSLSSIQQIDDP